MDREIKAKVRPSKEIIICIDIQPSELHYLADRLERGGDFNKVIHLRGSLNKELIDIRFIKPACHSPARVQEERRAGSSDGAAGRPNSPDR